MDKPKSSRGRFSLALLTLSLGALVLGIGLVVWALVNIGAESVPSEPYSDPPSSLTSATANQVWSAGDQAAFFPAEPSSDLPFSPTTLVANQAGSAGDQAAPHPAEAKRIPSLSSTSTLAVSQVKSTGDQVASYPKEGDTIGSLSIPVLKQKWPIIEGSGTNDLKRGVGHFIQSAMPGEADNCVLSGHRTTVFAKLGKLKIGDRLIVQTSAGTYTYEIARIRIVHKDDRTVIVPTDHAVLTLTTCYPFIFIGGAPDRYIVSADLVARQ